MGGVMGVAGFAVSAISKITGAIQSEKQLSVARATASIDRRLEVTNERLQKLNDTLKESYGIEAQKVAKETKDTIETRQKLALEGLKNSAYTKDWIVNGVIINKLAQDIGNKYGLDYGRAHDIFGSKQEDFSDLLNKNSLEDLIRVFRQMKEEGGELWAKLTSDSAVKQYVETLIDSIEQLEELEKNLREQILGTSFDDVFNSFMSSMYNMANGAKEVEEDMADDWQQMMNKMVLNNIIGEKYKKKLKEWYEMWYSAYSGDNQMTEEEIANLRKRYNDIVKEASKEVQALSEQGLIVSTEDDKNNEDKSASARASEKVTYDQMDEFTGILRSMQISGEQKLDVQRQILETLLTMSGISSPDSSDIKEIRNLLGISNDYLLDIKRSNRNILDEMTDRMDKIIDKLEDL